MAHIAANGTQMEELVEPEPLRERIRLAQREAYSAGNIAGSAGDHENGGHRPDVRGFPEQPDDCDRGESEHNVDDGEQPVEAHRVDQMHERAKQCGDPDHAHIHPADHRVVQCEEERRASAGDHQEDVRIVDAA